MKVKNLVEVIKKCNKEMQICVVTNEGKNIGLDGNWANDGQGWNSFSFTMRKEESSYSFINVCLVKHILQYEMKMNPIDIFGDEESILDYELEILEYISDGCARGYKIDKIEVKTDAVCLYLEE